MKISDKLCFESILAIPRENLNESVAVTVMGKRLMFGSQEHPLYYDVTGDRLTDGVWLDTGETHDNGQQSLPLVTVVPDYVGSLNVTFQVQAKVYSPTYLEALAVYIGTRLGASENTFYHIAQGQLLGRVTAEDMCRAALYAVCVGHGVIVPTGANTLEHVQELLTYSQQPYEVRPTAAPVEIGKQCLNLEFEELLEKADALGLRGHIERLMLDKIKGLIGENSNSEADGEEYVMLFDNDTNQVDLVALLDACIDQRVVADGTILKFGLGQAFHQAFMIVHENNLSKFPTDEKLAEESVAHHEANGVPCELAWNQRYADVGNFVIRRKADGKFLKPLGYQAPNLAYVLNQESIK
jgi:hypothetical protein